MRPNVEITHTLQGRIKDFAEERDLTLSEAYTELLEAGLDTWRLMTSSNGADSHRSVRDSRPSPEIEDFWCANESQSDSLTP